MQIHIDTDKLSEYLASDISTFRHSINLDKNKKLEVTVRKITRGFICNFTDDTHNYDDSNPSFHHIHCLDIKQLCEELNKDLKLIKICESCDDLFCVNPDCNIINPNCNICMCCCRKKILTSAFERDNNCTICQDTLANKGLIMKTDCGHHFHISCFKKLHNHPLKCPNCKKTICNSMCDICGGGDENNSDEEE